MGSIDRGVWLAPEGLTGAEVRALGPRLERLGYSTLWVGETFGRDPFAQLAAIGAATTELTLATGIANIYNRHPGVMLQGANTVAEQTGGRMILGLGVSSPAIVNKVRGIEYDKPLSFLRTYLDAMDQALYTSVPPDEPVPRVLAALGPKMLELAATRTAGAHPYNTTPEHTAMAREVMGPDAGLYVEQKVMLTDDAALARATGAKVLKFYSRAPGYRNAWLRMGFTEDDIDGLSEKLVDGLIAWGDVDRIEARLAEHADAGATHVCIHPLHPEQGQGAVDDEVLAALCAGECVVSERVTIDIADGVADVRLDRADKMNAMDGPMFAALVEAADELAGNNTVRAVVLSGNGPSFCAGLDFSGFQAMAGGAEGEDAGTGSIGSVEPDRAHVTHRAQQAVWGWHELPVPVIAAVHGVAFGAGCQLAVGADIRFVAPDVRMSVLEIRWGLSPDMTITSLLPSLVGADVAKELIWTGREVNGEEAVRIGLATHVADDPLSGAMELASLIASKSPDAIRAGKRLVNRVAAEDYDIAFAAERQEIGALIGGPNQVESVRAFFEKRPPVYVDPT